MVVGFVLMQCLDGIFTYLGVRIWGPAIEANPLVSSAMSAAALPPAWAARNWWPSASGMLLHLRRVHYVVALLTAIYFTVAILPWAALFLMSLTRQPRHQPSVSRLSLTAVRLACRQPQVASPQTRHQSYTEVLPAAGRRRSTR